jgi:TRAP-type mannitol/chloroaromatic compound transport system substrate-binding protein
VIDATEWVGPLPRPDHGLLYKAAKYYYYPGWHEPGTVLENFFNKKAYDACPRISGHRTSHPMRTTPGCLAGFDADNGAALLELINKHKVNLVQFPDNVMDDLRKLATEVVAEEAKRAPWPPR